MLFVAPVIGLVIRPSPTTHSRVPVVSMNEPADELFDSYAAEAPPTQGRLYKKCWEIVNEAIAATVPDAKQDPQDLHWVMGACTGQCGMILF